MIIDKISQMLHLTIPAMLSSVVGIATILICTRILGNYDADNYYLFAVFMPINYILIAINEAIRSSSLVLSSSCINYKENVAHNGLNLILFSMLLFGIIFLLFHQMKFWIASLVSIPPNKVQIFSDFSGWMIGSGAVICICYIFSSSFWAIRKPLSGMSINLIAGISTCLLTFLFTQSSDLSWKGYALSIIIAHVAAIFSACVLFNRNGLWKSSKVLGNLSSFLKKQKIIFKISLPVFLAYLVIFSSLFFIYAALGSFDDDVLTGFSIAYRVQNIVILPAITLGTAIAILSNQAKANNNSKEDFMFQLIGYSISILLYLVVSIVVFCFRDYLITSIIGETKAVATGVSYLKYVSLTYITLGPNLAYLTYLEQTGQGLRSLIINISYFIIAIGLGCTQVSRLNEYTYLFKVIALSNILFFIYLLFSFVSKNRPDFFKSQTTNKDVGYV